MRDRRGRGLRGPLLPADAPGHHSRAQSFDALVARTFASLRAGVPELADVTIAVEQIPEPLPTTPPVPLGAVRRTGAGGSLVVFRRPVQLRAGDPGLVADLVAELAADLLAVDPEQIDPHFPRSQSS